MSELLSRALGETFWYLAIGVPLTFAALAAVLVLASPAVLLFGVQRCLKAARGVVLFVGLLMLCGAPANAVFTLFMRDRFYYAADPVVDWLPWLPSGDWVLDIACGGHYLGGASALSLQLAWGALALPVWLLTLRVFKALVRRGAPNGLALRAGP